MLDKFWKVKPNEVEEIMKNFREEETFTSFFKYK